MRVVISSLQETNKMIDRLNAENKNPDAMVGPVSNILDAFEAAKKKSPQMFKIVPEDDVPTPEQVVKVLSPLLKKNGYLAAIIGESVLVVSEKYYNKSLAKEYV